MEHAQRKNGLWIHVTTISKCTRKEESHKDTHITHTRKHNEKRTMVADDFTLYASPIGTESKRATVQKYILQHIRRHTKMTTGNSAASQNKEEGKAAAYHNGFNPPPRQVLIWENEERKKKPKIENKGTEDMDILMENKEVADVLTNAA
eukprot:5122003-Ditylum_brightwellii.AAC.2